jgi:hypothetical protein
MYWQSQEVDLSRIGEFRNLKLEAFTILSQALKLKLLDKKMFLSHPFYLSLKEEISFSEDKEILEVLVKIFAQV